MLENETEIEFNDQFIEAINLINSSHKNVFITGRAGTGKSTLLNHLRNQNKKELVVLAPTGTAAINIKGQTIHSFFRFNPSITENQVTKIRFKSDEDNIYKNIALIIIDEISMVRADLLDCMDKFMRLNGKFQNKPFGGIQIVFIGDLYQLPPVITSKEKKAFSTIYSSPYFFTAKCFSDLKMEYIELEKIYRQNDQQFINILNSIRNNTIDDQYLQLINNRAIPDFQTNPDDFYIHLTPTNASSKTINENMLSTIKNKKHVFTGVINGDFANNQLPTEEVLELKIGAQIMLLINDTRQRFFNGSIGKIVDIKVSDNIPVLITLLDTNEIVKIKPYKWESYAFILENGHLTSTVTGSFVQYPVMLAWSITVHKSQGKTFDKVIFDVGRGTFAHGQMYVALSSV